MRAAKRCAALSGLTLLLLVLSAHVGTLDTFFTGPAGPFKVQVTVRPAGVVPGLAQVTVRVGGGAVTHVTTQAAQWNVGTRGAPAPDQAVRVPTDSALWSSELWLMTRGSYAVHVTVEGPAGRGAVAVPVSNIATQNLGMPTSLGGILGALGIFLSLGFVSLIGAAVRESVLPPGAVPTPARRTRARVAMVAATLLLVLALSAGRAWWNAVDAAYARGLYQPMQSSAEVRDVGGARVIRLAIADSNLLQQRTTPLIPDHGKIMHLFLVSADERSTLAHLHPRALDSATFEARAGSLPAGRYRYYADVVHESGFAETMLGSLQLAAPNAADSVRSDADDATSDAPAEPGEVQTIPGGASVTFERPQTRSLNAGTDVLLRFTVTERDGRLSVLTPYMGMPAHAIVTNADGSVFAHLHSNGSFSMAAQQVLSAIEQGDTLSSIRLGVPRPRIGEAHSMQLTADGLLEFPFAFPKAGNYTIWVQFKRGGTVQTAAFALTVT